MLNIMGTGADKHIIVLIVTNDTRSNRSLKPGVNINLCCRFSYNSHRLNPFWI